MAIEPTELGMPRGLARPDRVALIGMGIGVLTVIGQLRDYLDARRMVREFEASQQALRAGMSSPTEQGDEAGADSRNVGPDEVPTGEATGPSLGSAPLPPPDGPPDD